jgi:hypothetical protein
METGTHMEDRRTPQWEVILTMASKEDTHLHKDKEVTMRCPGLDGGRSGEFLNRE